MLLQRTAAHPRSTPNGTSPHHPVRVFVIKPLEISIRQGQVQVIEKRINLLKAILREEQARGGRRVYPQEGS
jgi:hypothetical protein